MRVLVFILSFTLLATLARAQPPGGYEGFWEHWGDGRAEVASYDLVFDRYGAPRKGTALAIFVTETFANSLRVKSDPGRRAADDEFPVMKLNLVQEFGTGIYDYHMMASVFLALEPVNGRPAGSPTKISFSSQEWCGHVWHQLLFDTDAIRESSFSYFDGEADRSGTLAYPPGGMTEDALMLWARGLAGPEVMPGTPVRVPLLRSLEHARLRHEDLAWTTVELSVSDETEVIEVPAGKFTTRRHLATIEDGPAWIFEIEDRFPYRLIRWEASDGRAASLRGVDRMKYWELTREGDERARQQVGLD